MQLILLPVFLLSGFASLVYQVVWQRALTQEIGIDSLSTSVIVACFMIGLGFGGALGGRLLKRAVNPLLMLALLELFVGVFGFASIDLLRNYNTSIVPNTNLIFQIILNMVFLLPPILAMGATAPVMVDIWERLVSSDRSIGYAYGVNVLGAALGILTGGFYLIGTYGLDQSANIVAYMDFLVTGLLLLLFVLFRGHKNMAAHFYDDYHCNLAQAQEKEVTSDKIDLTHCYIFAFVIGFVALSLEIVFFRFLTTYYSVTPYVFPMILFAYLVNMAVGTWLADQLIGRVNLKRILSWFVSLALIFILPSLFLHKIMELQGLQRYYFVFDPVATAFENNIIFVVKCILLSVILLLPVLFVSGIFPTMVRARAEGGVNTGQAFSYIYFVQTLGNAAGALVTGFVLFGVIGAQGTLALLAVLLVILFLFAPFPNARLNFIEKAMPVVISVITLSCLLFYKFNDSIKWPHGGKVLQETPFEVRESVHGMTYFYDIGSQQSEIYSAQASGKFHITSIPGENFLGGETLYGHSYASTEALAYSVKPDIRKILFIGIGTAQELVTFKVLFKDAEVTVVELNPELIDFMYEHSHKDIIETLNEYKVVVNDGRRYMQQLPEDEKFDYIHIGVDRASTTGAGNLFSREFIQKVHDRLNPDGVATFYGYPPVVNAAVDIYEDFAAFAPKSGIVVFLGSNTEGFVSKAIDSGEFAKNFAEAVSILSDKNGSAFIGDTKLTGLRESGWYMKKEQIEELFADINVTATDNLLATEYYINQETELQPQRMRTAFPLGLRKWIDVEDKVQPFPFPDPNAQIEYSKEIVLKLNNSEEFKAIKFTEGEADLLSTTDFSESGSINVQYPTILQIRGERDRLWKWQVGEALDVSEEKDMAYRLVLDADKDGRGIWGTLIECTDTEGNVIAQIHEETSTQNEDRVTALQDLGEVESANLCYFYLTFYSSVGWNKVSSFAIKSVAVERYSY